MRIAEINMVHFGSTGNIMLQLAEDARAHGETVHTYSPMIFHLRRTMLETPDIPDHDYFGTRMGNLCHRLLTLVTGVTGVYSYFGTKALIRKLKRFAPDVVHLHNLHNGTVCLPLLFRYLRKNRIKTVWTFHDCWPFTGKCPHFTLAHCDRWKNGCYHCPQVRDYPASYVDGSALMYRWKQRWYADMETLTVVTPSRWLAKLVEQSFLGHHPIRVIPNGIDLTVFTPTESDFRQKYHCEDQFVLFGSAYVWSERKGLDVFIELAGKLPAMFRIVLVGTDPETDAELPSNIISIPRTGDQKMLAQIYSTADLFVNPTREEVLGMVNIEALACGTPVIMFRTGGSPEVIDDSCGVVVDCDDIGALEREILRIAKEKPFSEEACLRRAAEFDMHRHFEEYRVCFGMTQL